MDAVIPETTSSKRSTGSNPNLVTTAGVITIINNTAKTIDDATTNRGKTYF